MNKAGAGDGLTLTVNGSTVLVPAGTSGESLLLQLGITANTAVAEVNGQHIPRSSFLPLVLSDGDQIELVSLVGGG